MLRSWAFSLLSVALVSAISLIGVIILVVWRELSKDSLLYLVSFSVGGLLGGAFFHLIPEATGSSGFSLEVSIWILFGILGSFFVEGILKWRHCHIPTTKEHEHTFAYINLFGDAVHNFIDGISIGAAYLIAVPTGIATTLAICLHEIPQEMGDFGVLIYAGFNKQRALLYNFLTALTAFLGVASARLLESYIGRVELFLLPFAAGNFIYIAGADLIPELHSEERLGRTVGQLVSMILGLVLLYIVGVLVPGG
ncbi:MAG: ZIP family metal transporter [Candidatus Bathyarchaeota archaeon]|jgi:zinc and cadmium transporter